MVHALERLQNQGDDKVSCIHHAFQFIIALVIAKHILHSTVYLSIFLQDTDYDILEAIKESKTVIEMLVELNDRTNRFRMRCISLHLT